MIHLRVDNAGLATTVQDQGRWGFQHQGVPVSGAADPYLLRLLNAIAGAGSEVEQGWAGLEFRLLGPDLMVQDERAKGSEPVICMALVGAPQAIVYRAGAPDQAETIPPLYRFALSHGDRVKVGATGADGLGFLAVTGGIGTPVVMGSRSTFLRGGFGGLDGRCLSSGDRLPVGFTTGPLPVPASGWGVRTQDHAFLSARSGEDGPDVRLRIIAGPQAHHVTAEAWEIFLSEPYRVTPQADRMGVRLEGPVLAHDRDFGADIASDGTALGVVQLPGNGQPILLSVDRQTTGGYPKIAVVCSTDIPAMVRLQPGQRVRFEAISPQTARQLADRRTGAETRLIHSLGPCSGHVDPQDPKRYDSMALLTANLISGVVDGTE